MRTSGRSRQGLVTLVAASLALSALGTGGVCLARGSRSRASEWHGGWGSLNGWWGPHWWGTGRFISVLPWNYQSFWWDGRPYYFGGASFYAWNGAVGKFEEVTPPIGFNQPHSRYVKMSNGIPKLSGRLFAYPERGQGPAQQARDKAACMKLAKAKDAPHPAAAKPPPSKPARPVRRGRRGRRRHASAPVASPSQIDTLALQHALLSDEATCLRKRHYSVR